MKPTTKMYAKNLREALDHLESCKVGREEHDGVTADDLAEAHDEVHEKAETLCRAVESE